jgi:glycosyltransferase involved in cell wall biosynthesis
MSARALHIAWLGPVPGGEAGVTGVNAELLHGLARLGHRIDCFFPSAGHPVPPDLVAEPNLTFVWGTSKWQWDRWYSRNKVAAFASGLFSRSLASLRLRRAIARRHRRDRYDVVYQFSTIETPAVPSALRRKIPLVIHPETHAAGELRLLIRERRLSLRCQPVYVFALVSAIMAVRTLAQRFSIRHAGLLVCISSVFRDHLVRDYGFPLERTTVIPNPIHIDRFTTGERRMAVAEPPVVLVLGRVSARKGVEDVVSVSKRLAARHGDLRIRVVGGASLWSDYTKLLEDLSPETAEYCGPVSAAEIPELLRTSDLLLQASKYEPFALTVAEALASGVPVVATSEVGAIEGVDRSVVAAIAPGDVDGMAAAITNLLGRLRANPAKLRSTARSEAERLFAGEVVCKQISSALERLVDGAEPRPPAERPPSPVAPAQSN